MSYDVSEKFLELLSEASVDDPNPGVLDLAHRLIFDLPPVLYKTLGCKGTLRHMRTASTVIRGMVTNLGMTGWPVDPGEVARRAVQNFLVLLQKFKCQPS